MPDTSVAPESDAPIWQGGHGTEPSAKLLLRQTNDPARPKRFVRDPGGGEPDDPATTGRIGVSPSRDDAAPRIERNGAEGATFDGSHSVVGEGWVQPAARCEPYHGRIAV